MKHLKSIQDLPSDYQTLILILCDQDPEYFPLSGSGPAVNERLVKLADRHRLIPLFYSYLERHPESQNKVLMDHVKKLARNSAMKSLTLQAELLKICREFNRLDIKYLVIKGPQLSHFLYDDAAKRESVDLDLFLQDPDQMAGAARILSRSGYKRTNYPEGKGFFRRWLFITGKHESTFINQQVRTVIDLHMRPVGNTVLSSGFYRYFFSDIEKYMINAVQIPVPGEILYFTFLCYHGAVHRYASLHWLADIYSFYRKCRFSTGELMRLSGRLRLRRHMLLSLFIINRYCKVDLPQDFISKHTGSVVLKILLADFHRNLIKEKDNGFTLKGRLEKTIYRFLLSEGFTGKTDVLLSILSRYVFRGFRLKQRMRHIP